MSYKEEIHGDVYVLVLKGNLMGGPETSAIHSRVKELSEVGVKQIVLDLGNVKWMNSSGLGTLMSCLTTTKNGGGALKLARVAEKVESLLMITQLLKIFETHDKVDDAIKSFH